MSSVRHVAISGCVAVLVGCSSAPPSLPRTAETPVSSSGSTQRSAFEQQYRDRAESATRLGPLAEAVVAWEVLTVLRPESRDYRESLADVRRQIDVAVTDRTRRAAQAQRRGDLDGAAQLYLAALAMQPDLVAAADALRGIERERVKRQQLGRPSRLILTRRAASEAMTEKPAAPTGVDRNELEHVAMLARQGELEAAIGLAERRVAADRKDDAARELLADLYQRKAEELVLARDSTGAIVLLEKSLRLDPGDARAAERLRQIKATAAPRPADPKVR
ncbi:MAG: hypothetical protein QFE16_00015 [Pseudomonadota bacterium]|nr:hypothetical protein [Pseudomonadota bacterium]